MDPSLLIFPTVLMVPLGTRLDVVDDTEKLVPNLALMTLPIEVPVEAVIMSR